MISAGLTNFTWSDFSGGFDMKRYSITGILALLVLALTVVGGMAQDNTKMESIRVEVAEDGNRFVFGKERLFGDGMPDYGSPFVTQGYLYPEGTLNGSNGVLADGSPEFPDKVVGTWTCYGYMIGEGAHTTTGTWVVSTQIYKFNEDNSTIVTSGFEIVDLNTPAARAIVGGTGKYRSAQGEQIQELHGFTEQMGVNLVVEFQFDS
jgi:hypothetical protein